MFLFRFVLFLFLSRIVLFFVQASLFLSAVRRNWLLGFIRIVTETRESIIMSEKLMMRNSYLGSVSGSFGLFSGVGGSLQRIFVLPPNLDPPRLHGRSLIRALKA